MKKSLILVVLVLAGCHSTSDTSQETKKVASNTNEQQQVCELSATTGSNLKKRRCMSRKVAETIRKTNQESMRKINRGQQVGTANKN